MDIFRELQAYVPCYQYDDERLEAQLYHKTLIGGDYLTVKRARGAQLDKCNELHAAEQLRGLVPVQDWHTRQCLMTVSLAMLILY